MNLIFKLREFVMKNSDKLVNNNIDSKKQMQIIDTFNEPIDTIERAFFQYKCTMRNWNKLGICLAEIASFVLFPIYLYRLKKINLNFIEQLDMVCFLAPDQNGIIPSSLRKNYPIFKLMDTSELMCLEEADICYLKNINKRFKANYYFKFKIMLRVAAYSAQLKRFSPKVFVSAAEHSFANTICTDYCDFKGVENIACQHGEYWRRMSGSFFFVHRYYTWDNYYVELHEEHKAYLPQIYVEVPDSIHNLKIDLSVLPKFYATYYLAYENQQELKKIKIIFDELKKYGKECKIRLHPRGRINNGDLVSTIFNDYLVEDCNTVSLGSSITNSQYLMSIRSTVLLQGYLNGKSIIIDNITDPQLFENLKDWGYIMLAKEHKLLTQIIKEIKDNERKPK